MNFSRFLVAVALLIHPAISLAETARLAELDRVVAATYPDTIYKIVTSIGRPDDTGLIGRNREWGNLHSVRFQYGAGRALRHGLASNDPDLLNLARYAIQAGLDTIQPDGAFPASLPEMVSGAGKPGLSDQASAAAFFLSDVCPALLLAGHTEQEFSRVRSAITWLSQHQARLLLRDQGAPNRLLINALAFGGCGHMIQDADVIAKAEPFIDAALALTRNDGVFVEAGGSDTSYQAVNLVVAIEMVALGLAGSHDQALRDAVARGGMWLSNRIGSDGALDSAGNTRTCADEAFLGRPKSVDLREVFRALSYAKTFEGWTTSGVSAFETWLMQNPEPCPGGD